jgi:hypothetical protein
MDMHNQRFPDHGGFDIRLAQGSRAIQHNLCIVVQLGLGDADSCSKPVRIASPVPRAVLQRIFGNQYQ